MSEKGRIGQTLLGGDAVERSADLARVVGVERRERPVEGTPEAEELIATVTGWFARPPRATCDCHLYKKPCITRLRMIQAWALMELGTERGCFGLVPTGHGKTLIGILAPLALRGCKEALLLVKPNLIGQLKKDYAHISQHFRVPSIRVHGPEPMRTQQPPGPDGSAPPLLHVLSYNMLSGADATVMLESMRPDFVISDEMQCLADPKSTRTRRFQRYMADADERGVDPRFACWSGTPTDDSLMNYWHLIITALRENAPLPIDKLEAEAWAGAIDPGTWPSPPGALSEPGVGFCAPGEHVQMGYFRRLVDTPGVISTDAPAADVELEVRDRTPHHECSPSCPCRASGEPRLPPGHEDHTGELIPGFLLRVMNDVRDTWLRPDGLQLYETAIEKWRCLHQLANGFYLRWEFVRGETDRQIETWVERRKDWNKSVRDVLEQNRPHMDSPYLCAVAAARFLAGHDDLPDAPAWDAWSWEPWAEVANTVDPITVPVRLCDFAARDAARWALDEGPPGIVWYDSVELGQWIAELSGLPLHDGGPTAGDRIDAEDGSRSIVASIRSHGTGRDGLQYKFARQLITQPFSSALGYEQCLDASTEILTNQGWLGIDADWSTAQAAAYAIEDGSIRWSAPARTERLLGVEQMYGISNPHLDIRVTAGHRMIASRGVAPSRSRGMSYQVPAFVTAEDMPALARLPLAGRQEARSVPLTDHEIMFLGLFMSDGSLSEANNAISIFQSERYPDIIRLIESTLDGCGFRYGHSVNTKPTAFGPRSPLHRWTISRGPPLSRSERHLRGWEALEPYVGKDLPPTLEDLDERQLRILIRGLWAGDGGKTAGTYSYDRYTPGTTLICTGRKVVADRVQALCVRRGMRCNVSLATQGSVWLMHISDDLTWTCRRQASDGRPVWGPVACDPNERVWCIGVETGAIVTRRNGKVAVVGNCFGRLARVGQVRDVVTDVYTHTKELVSGLETAVMRARYVERTTGMRQKLLAGW